MNRGGDVRQRQARALGDPTRHAIFQVVAAADAPVSVAELTQMFSLNHNAVRQHLVKLHDAGLVTEASLSHPGPGRPSLVYQASLSAEVWLSVGPYEQLTLMLLEMRRTGRSPREVGADVGAAVAHRMPSTGDSLSALAEVIAAEMDRRGFEPVRSEADDGIDVVLQHCPFAAAAAGDPDVVCELHRGMAEGMVAVVSGPEVQVELTARPPAHAGCRFRLTRAAPAAEGAPSACDPLDPSAAPKSGQPSDPSSLPQVEALW